MPDFGNALDSKKQEKPEQRRRPFLRASTIEMA